MDAHSPGDSLGKRYVFKLASNVATVPLFLVMEAVLPRALGPAVYGNYNFATALFQNATNFMDMGTSTCLSTNLAKRPGEFGLVAFYARAALAMLLLCLGAGAATHIPGLGGILLPGTPLWLAVPAAFWAYLTWAGRVARSMNDALGVTTRSELVRICVNTLSALALLLLFQAGFLTLPVLFLHQYIFLSLLALGFCYTLRGVFPAERSKPFRKRFALSQEETRAYAASFWRFSSPLFVTALCTGLALSGERWLLQFFSGSVEQGYFSLSHKIGLACLLFVSAMTPLLMRELVVAQGKEDPEGMGRLLDRYAPMLYAIAAWIACFSLVEAPAMVRLFGGSAFAEALVPVQIMAFFPVHNGYGQIAGSVFYATGQTPLLRNLHLITLLLGVITAYFLLAAPAFGGLGLGATGLAVKMVAIQIVSVNILLGVCRRFAPFNFSRNLAHQLVCPAVLLCMAFLCRFATTWLGLGSADSLIRFTIAGLFYCGISMLLPFTFPFVLGLNKREALSLWARFVTALRRKK